MSDASHSSERQRNLWAPWRMEYIDTLSQKDDGCFLCRYAKEPEEDARNLVLFRGRHCFALLNRFPYTGGHTMIAPYAHVGDLADLGNDCMLEMMQMLRDTQKILSSAVSAQGFNVGINIGRCAGAGLTGHLHLHIVPRWSGETNFIAVFGGVRVIPQTLEELFNQIKKAAGELGLPKLEKAG